MDNVPLGAEDRELISCSILGAIAPSRLLEATPSVQRLHEPLQYWDHAFNPCIQCPGQGAAGRQSCSTGSTYMISMMDGQTL